MLTIDPAPLVATLAWMIVGAAEATTVPSAGDRSGSKPASADAVHKLADELERSYVFEDRGAALADSLRKKTASGAWQGLAGDALAEALTAECQGLTRDKHLRVRFEDGSKPAAQSPFLFQDPAAARRAWIERNHGFERAERLQGNVGYLELRAFAPGEGARSAAAAAMAFLQDTDALILDLRRNGGGQPETVQFLCSYFFGPEPVHLNDLVNREMGTRDEYWTLRELSGRRYLDKPVWVLVGAKTFSGAEECAYNLQSLKRATIVGVTTGGGAHPIDRRELGGGFWATIPIARAENPVTKTNWEGVGVLPDVEVDEALALERAYGLALDALAERTQDAVRRKDLQALAAEQRAKIAR